jgi:hypothetical protein
MATGVVGEGRSGSAFLIAAGLTYEAIAKACSSPQTAELNADKRAPTLMKWVNIGIAEAAGLVIIAAIIDRQHRVEILAGGALAAGITYAEYLHAKSAGLKNPGAPTESW